MDMYTFLESARQGAADKPIKTPKSWNFFFDSMGVSANFSRHRYMGVKDLLGKILLAHPDQYTPEHLLKPENYQKVEKNGLSPPSNSTLLPC